MKILLYFILIIAFLIFYQQNPLFTIVIIIIFLTTYLFFKSRRGDGKISGNSFFTGKKNQHNEKIDELITLIMLQQLLKPPSPLKEDIKSPNSPELNQEQTKLEKTKNEILSLLQNLND